MSHSKYVPSTDEVRLAYIDRKDFEAQLNRSWADEGAARAEFDRFVAKIKADSLRSAANDLAVKLQTLLGGQEKLFVEVDRLRELARRIEEEA